MKHINIECPQGYEIDKEKSTFEKIIFKEVKQLPKHWEDLDTVTGWYTSINGTYCQTSPTKCTTYSRNLFLNEEQAEASIALAQLSQLREVYRQGWTPDWTICDSKFCVLIRNGKLIIETWSAYAYFLSFQDEQTAKLFRDNFKDLINQAAPLLF